ncbi:MAG: Ig-like domain-containing protein [Parcubacteria group bacterium]|nr:Ig-like domain-containing protein [Parcubacteria group bacterium]
MARILCILTLFSALSAVSFFASSVLFAATSSSSFRTIQAANIGAPECSDGIDNDGDTLTDFPADTTCASVAGVTEGVPAQCYDGIDNDADGLIDYPADPGCTGTNDNDETNGSGGGGGGGDITPPSINSLTPADNATDVSTTTTLVIEFNEPVVAQSGNIKIKKTSDGSTVQTISITSAQAVISPGSRLTVTLATLLLQGIGYYVELDSGIVSDGVGNAFAGLSGAAAWNFTTAGDSTPPQISNVAVTPGTTLADLSWVTDEPAVSSFFWGTTTDYATGAGAEVVYSQNHTTTLPGLAAHTLYYYKIEARDVSGNKSTVTGSFTTLVISDTTPPANPSGFTAVAGTNSIALSWTNPSDADFDSVRIMRLTSGYPTGLADGIMAYQGSAESASDMSVSLGVRYYYTIFARDTSLNYSSGAIASAIIDSVPVVLPPPTESPPITPPSTGGGDPPPVVTPPIIPPPPPEVGTSTPPITPPILPSEIVELPSLAFADFDFFERGTKEETEKRIAPKKDRVSIIEAHDLKISLNVSKVSSEAKLFIVSMGDPVTGKTSSYLLQKNEEEAAYETIIASMPGGQYPVSIKIYDSHNALLHDVNGILMVRSEAVSALLNFLPSALMETVTPVVEAVSPVAAPVGVAIGVSQAVVLATNVGSFYDLYLLFLKFVGLITGFFRKKKPEPWGVVYDSVTKQPIDPAYVVVSRMGQEEKKSAITDLDGRYGFLLAPGAYSLAANKTHYKFPSDNLAGRARDELYDNLYFGSPFELLENQIVRYNVPLDPIEFDWNEFAKNKDKIFSLYSRRQKIRIWLFNSLFYIGLGIAVYGVLLSPTKLNISLLAIYGAIIVFQSLWKRQHRVTNLIDGKTGGIIPFALISVTVPGLGVLVRKVVTDQFGRFYLLVAPGTYDITIQAKQPDGSYATVSRQTNVYLKKGTLTKDVVL